MHNHFIKSGENRVGTSFSDGSMLMFYAITRAIRAPKGLFMPVSSPEKGEWVFQCIKMMELREKPKTRVYK